MSSESCAAVGECTLATHTFDWSYHSHGPFHHGSGYSSTTATSSLLQNAPSFRCHALRAWEYLSTIHYRQQALGVARTIELKQTSSLGCTASPRRPLNQGVSS